MENNPTLAPPKTNGFPQLPQLPCGHCAPVDALSVPIPPQLLHPQAPRVALVLQQCAECKSLVVGGFQILSAASAARATPRIVVP